MAGTSGNASPPPYAMIISRARVDVDPAAHRHHDLRLVDRNQRRSEMKRDPRGAHGLADRFGAFDELLSTRERDVQVAGEKRDLAARPERPHQPLRMVTEAGQLDRVVESRRRLRQVAEEPLRAPWMQSMTGMNWRFSTVSRMSATARSEWAFASR
jgi:hypothetical protein